MGVKGGGDDPWAAVVDLAGTAHYDVLGLPREATQGEVKAAYRKAARAHHPDKGGDAAVFAKVRLAFEVLGDPARRATYDALGGEHAYRCIPGVTLRARGGEGVLLDDMERLGMHVDGGTQLVVLCEVCGRPSNKVCYACECRYCDFCARKLHWKGNVGLHYPVSSAPGSMAKKIAEKELEEKRIEDAKRRQLEDPNFRNEAELRELRVFKEAAADVYHGGCGGTSVLTLADSSTRSSSTRTAATPHHHRRYDHRLARYYMWAQTNRHVHVAIHVPTGYADRAMHVEVMGGALGILKVQPEDSPPVVERQFAFPIDQGAPVETCQSKDKRRVTLSFTKARPGEVWQRLFEGDPDYARCMEPPYRLEESPSEVVLEVELPFWIEASDVRVDVTSRGLELKVNGELENLRRTFWKDPESGDSKAGSSNKLNKGDVILAEETAWSLDKEMRPDTGENFNLLMVCMVKRAPTKTERQYKRNDVQDNRYAVSDANPSNCKGVRLFTEDQDDFGLEDDLMALCFLETGSTWRPAKPWNKYWDIPKGAGRTGDYATEDARVDRVEALPERARAALDQLLRMDEKEEDDNIAGHQGEATWDD